MSLVGNERTKLTATYLNGVAIAIFAIGALVPLVSPASGDKDTVSGLSIWIVVGCVVSSFAYISLRGSSSEGCGNDRS